MPRMPHGAKVSPYDGPSEPSCFKQEPAFYKYSKQNELSSFANRTAAP